MVLLLKMAGAILAAALLVVTLLKSLMGLVGVLLVLVKVVIVIAFIGLMVVIVISMMRSRSRARAERDDF
jgi:amino acid permease